MPEIIPEQTRDGFRLALDGYSVEARFGKRKRDDSIQATVAIFDANDERRFLDNADLTAAKGRDRFIKRVEEEAGITIQPGVLIALEDVFEQKLDLDAEQRAARASRVRSEEGDDDFPYTFKHGGIVYYKPTKDGFEPVLLAGFDAEIVADVVRDDGASRTREFEICARLRGREHRFRVPAEQFAGLNWVLDELGAKAIVHAGYGVRDRLREAIQLLSKEIAEREVYGHVGWQQIEGHWRFLHAEGAIGANGLEHDVEVELPPSLQAFVLPEPNELREAVRSSLRLLEVAPDDVMCSLLGAVYRAPLGGSDFSEHLVGPTGVGKSELMALAQQHFGAGFDAEHLPATWLSTANANAELAFLAKDALLAVDDFAPAGTRIDVQRMQRDADRLFRSQGNRSGRQRMRADTTLRHERPPRGLILSSGEDSPRGQSLQARMWITPVTAASLDWAALTLAQGDARTGLLACAMSGYIQFIAGLREADQLDVRREREELRNSITGLSHQRTPEIVADLTLGWTHFLDYAVHTGALSRTEADELLERVRAALIGLAHQQSSHQRHQEPATRFIELLTSALATGRAHLATALDQSMPLDPTVWGWRRDESEQYSDWRPQGDRIGWVAGDAVYLDLNQSVAVAKRLAEQQGEPLTVNSTTLIKRLHEQGHLASTDDARETLKVRRLIAGKRMSVVHVNKKIFTSLQEPDQPDQPDQLKEAVVGLVGFSEGEGEEVQYDDAEQEVFET